MLDERKRAAFVEDLFHVLIVLLIDMVFDCGKNGLYISMFGCIFSSTVSN
jgi:hypothetical protein